MQVQLPVPVQVQVPVLRLRRGAARSAPALRRGAFAHCACAFSLPAHTCNLLVVPEGFPSPPLQQRLAGDAVARKDPASPGRDTGRSEAQTSVARLQAARDGKRTDRLLRRLRTAVDPGRPTLQARSVAEGAVVTGPLPAPAPRETRAAGLQVR